MVYVRVGYTSVRASATPISFCLLWSRMTAKGSAFLSFGLMELERSFEKVLVASKVCYVPTSEFVCTIPNPSLQKLQHEISNFTNKNIIEGENFVCYIHRVTSLL